VDWCFIEPGKPIENAYIESFNARFREKCLNENWFTSLADARQKIGEWRQDTTNGDRTASTATPIATLLCYPACRDSRYDWIKNGGPISRDRSSHNSGTNGT
jgi:hypothetical protein